jgi:hypothetical protein
MNTKGKKIKPYGKGERIESGGKSYWARFEGGKVVFYNIPDPKDSKSEAKDTKTLDITNDTEEEKKQTFSDENNKEENKDIDPYITVSYIKRELHYKNMGTARLDFDNGSDIFDDPWDDSGANVRLIVNRSQRLNRNRHSFIFIRGVTEGDGDKTLKTKSKYGSPALRVMKSRALKIKNTVKKEAGLGSFRNNSLIVKHGYTNEDANDKKGGYLTAYNASVVEKIVYFQIKESQVKSWNENIKTKVEKLYIHDVIWHGGGPSSYSPTQKYSYTKDEYFITPIKR